MSAGITVQDFHYIPGKNDAEYIKCLEELHKIDSQLIRKAVGRVKELSKNPEVAHHDRRIDKELFIRLLDEQTEETITIKDILAIADILPTVELQL